MIMKKRIRKVIKFLDHVNFYLMKVLVFDIIFVKS